MKKLTLTIPLFGMLLFVADAGAAPTAQQNCDSARILAWKTYTSCVEGVTAKVAQGRQNAYGDFLFDVNKQYAAFAKCRHAYFKKWTAFQAANRKPPLAGSTCVGLRFSDNGNQTVTDNLTGLVWEKKSNLDSTVNYADPHDADNHYTWSNGSPYAENGEAFTDFLASLNGGGGFAAANGWRLPTLSELQSIVLDFECRGSTFPNRCSCPVAPCVEPALDAAHTASDTYWSITAYLLVTSPFVQGAPNPNHAWVVDFGSAIIDAAQERNNSLFLRAVRGGL